ncbi:MAG: energy transducer TonB [Litorimonas sp.]
MQLLRARPCNFNSAPDFLAYKWDMYQVIDEQDDEDLAAGRGFSVLPFLIGAVLAGIVFFIVWLMSPGQQIEPGVSVETPASRAAYLTALSEPNPAVRRARLMDYQRVYPDTDRSAAIETQLDVINAAELEDWDFLVQAVYDERAPLGDKQTAMADYEKLWNGRLLGGRGEELESLRNILDETKAVDALPDRSLDPGESPISEAIPSDVLAGAPPSMAVTFPVFEPQPDTQPSSSTKDVVVQPTVRRNRSPNYPRSAKRRNIGAIVVVAMNIDDKGRVASVDIVDIEAERYQKEFIRAAERAAKRTRFNPKTVNGKPVPAIGVRKRYIFRSE